MPIILMLRRNNNPSRKMKRTKRILENDAIPHCLKQMETQSANQTLTKHHMEQYSKTPERASMAAIAHAMELRYDVRARENDIKLIDYELFK